MTTSTTRRVLAAGVLSLPLAMAASGVASATESHSGHDCGGATAAQKGGLLGLNGTVDPGINLGGIGNTGAVSQSTSDIDASNSGIQQDGGCSLAGTSAFSAGDLVKSTLAVNPGLNIGGILNQGPVSQSTSHINAANSGIQQAGGGHGHGGAGAVQSGGLVDLGLDVSPGVNIGGLLSGGPVSQSTVHYNGGNSGIQQR